MAPITAPPSPTNVLVSTGSQLQAGLAQAQSDAATLQALLASWPADLPTDLQPVVEITERLINYLSLLAQGTAAIANHLGLTL